MGSRTVVYTGSSRGELSEERKVSRYGRNSGSMKDLQRLGWPCWSNKGNQMSTSYIPFFSPISPSIRCFYIFHILISGLFIPLFRRASQHIRYLLDSISQFPRINPSASDPASDEIDIPKLLRQIRSRYKVLCSSLGVRPRLQSAEVAAMEDKESPDRMDEDEVPTRTTPGSAIPVWKIDKRGMKKPVTNQDLSF